MLCFSGCKDDQTSADVREKSIDTFGLDTQIPGSGGALTSAMLQTLQSSDRVCFGFMTYAYLLRDMRVFLRGQNFSQRPMLSTNVNFLLNLHLFNVNKLLSANSFKALQIGINYKGTDIPELGGCHNDVLRMKEFMVKKGFEEKYFTVMLDDGKHEKPTKANILAQMKNLVKGAKDGDVLFLQYSGHGATMDDTSTDEADGQDETICPVDRNEPGVGDIVDDELHDILVKGLPTGVKLLCVFDCCHSGSILDLAYYHQYIDRQENLHAKVVNLPGSSVILAVAIFLLAHLVYRLIGLL